MIVNSDIPAAVPAALPGQLRPAAPLPQARSRGLLQHGRGRGDRLQDQHLALHLLTCRVHRGGAPLAHLDRVERGAHHLSQQLLHQVAQFFTHSRYVIVDLTLT